MASNPLLKYASGGAVPGGHVGQPLVNSSRKKLASWLPHGYPKGDSYSAKGFGYREGGSVSDEPTLPVPAEFAHDDPRAHQIPNFAEGGVVEDVKRSLTGYINDFGRALNPDLLEMAALLRRTNPGLSVSTTTPSDGASVDHSYANNAIRITPRYDAFRNSDGKEATLTHEAVHALDYVMGRDAVRWERSYAATPEQKAFADAQTKLYPASSKVPKGGDPDPQYRHNGMEARAFGVGNMAVPKNFQAFRGAPHYDATMASEAAVLRDLYRRALGQEAPGYAGGGSVTPLQSQKNASPDNYEPFLPSLVRGWTAGLGGLPGDLEEAVRSLIKGGATPDSPVDRAVDAHPVLPTSEFYKDWLPGQRAPSAAAGLAEDLSTSLGGVGITNLLRGAKSLPAALKALMKDTP